MKLKFWQGEFEFDRDDAVIVIPIILLLLGFATPLSRVWLLVGFAAYYAILLLAWKLTEPIKKVFKRLYNLWLYRCRYCKSRDVFLQGYQGYHSDEYYGYWLCNDCGETSIDIGDRLIKSEIRKRSIGDGRPTTTTPDTTEISDEDIPF